MRVSVSTVSLFLVLLTAAPAMAQLELPAPSPAAKVMQRVGLTDITVEYSSPAVKGRKIWGELVPYDKSWRTGANAATKITFSRDVMVGGKPVAAGTYGMISFPSAKTWTIIISRNTQIDAGGKPYDPATDDKDVAAKLDVTTSAIPLRERMTFVFADTTDGSTSLDLEWEKLRVSIPITADTGAQALANIDKAIGEAWRPHLQAARYALDTLKDNEKALAYANASIAIKSVWINNWIKADALHRLGKNADAIAAAKTAWDLGNADPNFYYKDAVKKAVDEWKP